MTNTYNISFRCSPYHPDEQMADWVREHNVLFHGCFDTGYYSTRDLHYSSPTLTGGEIKIAHCNEGQYSNKCWFTSSDPKAAV